MNRNLVINGRTATQKDVDERNCVFYIPDNRSRPYSLGRPLPIPARVSALADNGPDFFAAGTQVEIVQAEVVDETFVYLGIVCGDEEGICTLEGVEIE